MIDHSAADVANAAIWQTGIAIIQAITSVGLLAWYVGAARAARRLARDERAADFDSLVRLCRDLGLEAKEKTDQHRQGAEAAGSFGADDARQRLAAWRSDMTVVYVCLNEVPHYEVRNPNFSTALTRLWLEVDPRAVQPAAVENRDQLKTFLAEKLSRICREVDAMADLIGSATGGGYEASRLSRKAGRRGKQYQAFDYSSSR